MITKFITTTSDKLTTHVPVVDGQVIALSDKNAWFYDMGGQRHSVISNVYCQDNLPASGDADTLYVLAGTQATSGIYIWASNQFVKLCGLDSEKVQTAADNGLVYLVGVTEGTDGSYSLKKNINVTINLATREASIIASDAKHATKADEATKATGDADGNDIQSTYVKGISASKNDGVITFTVTKGDDNTSTFDVNDSDTTYENFQGTDGSAAGAAGLVPAPATGDKDKFLRADGSWGNPVNTEYSAMSGATASAPGSSGLAPAPAAGEQDKFLKGDGTWGTPANDNTEYGPMSGATSSADGAEGLVPAPSAGDQDKFLKGDGSWSEVETTDTKNTVGATAASGKIFIVGAGEQTGNPQSYTNSKAYVDASGKVFSNGKEVVNLDDTQALTNKTYNGYTLGAASEKGLATDIADTDTGLPTAAQVHAALEAYLNSAKGYTDTAVGGVVQFQIEVVDALPTTDIKNNTIYLVPNGESSGENVRTEYMRINNQWEIIGNTEIDLSNYPTTSEMESAISTAVSGVSNGLSIVDGKLCITYEQE